MGSGGTRRIPCQRYSNSANCGGQNPRAVGDSGPHRPKQRYSYRRCPCSGGAVSADNPITATPGTFVHVPAGTIHAFRFAAGGGEMISVAGQTSRAAHVFTTIDHEVPAGPLDIPKLLAVAQKCGVTIAI